MKILRICNNSRGYPYRETLRAIFWKKNNEKKEDVEISEDIMRVPRLIEPLLNQAALDIVDTYKNRLVKEPVTYIVPAIWGAKEKEKWIRFRSRYIA